MCACARLGSPLGQRSVHGRRLDTRGRLLRRVRPSSVSVASSPAGRIPARYRLAEGRYEAGFPEGCRSPRSPLGGVAEGRVGGGVSARAGPSRRLLPALRGGTVSFLPRWCRGSSAHPTARKVTGGESSAWLCEGLGGGGSRPSFCLPWKTGGTMPFGERGASPAAPGRPGGLPADPHPNRAEISPSATGFPPPQRACAGLRAAPSPFPVWRRWAALPPGREVGAEGPCVRGSCRAGVGCVRAGGRGATGHKHPPGIQFFCIFSQMKVPRFVCNKSIRGTERVWVLGFFPEHAVMSPSQTNAYLEGNRCR